MDDGRIDVGAYATMDTDAGGGAPAEAGVRHARQDGPPSGDEGENRVNALSPAVSAPRSDDAIAPLVTDLLADTGRDALVGLVATMLDAVAFYAEPDTYRAVTFRSSAPRGGFDSDRGGAGSPTFGRRARELLALPEFARLVGARASLQLGTACPDCGGELREGTATLSSDRGGREVRAEVAARTCASCGASFTDADAEAVLSAAVIGDLGARLAAAEARAALSPDPDAYSPVEGEVEAASREFDPAGWEAPDDWESTARRRSEVMGRMGRGLAAAARHRAATLRSAAPGTSPDAPEARESPTADRGDGNAANGVTEG